MGGPRRSTRLRYRRTERFDPAQVNHQVQLFTCACTHFDHDGCKCKNKVERQGGYCYHCTMTHLQFGPALQE